MLVQDDAQPHKNFMFISSLCSSAFMSLAARFPLKSKSSNTLVEVPEFCVVKPADRITYGRGTGELWRDSETSRINESLIKPNSQSSEEEFLSSQDSLDSSITQDARIKSSSGSNSESEGLNSGCGPIKAQISTSTNSLQVAKTTMFQEFYNSVNGVSLFEERTGDGKLQQAEPVKQSSRVGRNDSHSFHSAINHPSSFGYQQKQQLPVAPSTDYKYTQGRTTFQMNGEEFSRPQTVPVHSEFQDNNYRRFGIREVGDGADKPTLMQYGNGTLGSPELATINPYGPLSNHSVLLQDTSESRPHTNYNQPSPNHHLEGQKTLQSDSEGRSCAESLNTSHILGRGQDDAVDNYSNIPKHAEKGFNSEKIISTATRQVCADNSRAELKPQKQVYSPGPKEKESKLKVPKARKMKPETKKKHAGDWDKLRKAVQENGTKQERSKDTMDSLDYEAVRCASVNEIAESIKDRGMHFMLAERIKV